MNRRQFIAGLGAFFILPSAGRIWKAIDTRRVVAGSWTAAQLDIYDKLPYYLAQQQLKHPITAYTWKTLLSPGVFPLNQGEVCCSLESSSASSLEPQLGSS